MLDGIGQGWRRHVTYQVRSDVRGRFEIGPMTVRVSDPFGLVELGRTFRTTVPLTVTPRTVPLPHIPLGGAWTGSGDNRPRAFATGSAEDVTVREYRRGDDLRRVHWRSSARVGELMVRREEQPWQSRATLFLDNRLRAHRGQGIASSLEAAVSAAASIAVHLSHRGFAVRLVTATGEDPSSAWHFRDADLNTGPLLEALAVVQAVHQPQLDTGWLDRGRARRPHGRRLRRRRGHRPPGAAPDAAPRRLGAGDRRSTSTPGSAPPAHRRRHPRRSPSRAGGRSPLRPARPARRRLAGARPQRRPASRVRRSADPAPGGRSDEPRRRGGLGADLLLAGTAAATTWLAMCVVARLHRWCPAASSARCSLLAVVVAGTGALARWWRLPGAAVVGLAGASSPAGLPA